MKQIIKRNKKNNYIGSDTKDEFLIECQCGRCGLLKFSRYDYNINNKKEEEYNLQYFSSNNLLKRDKQGYDLCFDKEQIEELILRLQEMVNVK